ncbi:hypothetical protein ES702_01703 [subsurface metagenome]
MSYAVDWATRKEIKVCNTQTGKIKNLPNQIEQWERWLRTLRPSDFYLEEGGGDSFKLLCRKLGHKVFTVPGIWVKRQREAFGLKKDDRVDVVVLSNVVKLQPTLFREFQEDDILIAKVYLVYKGLEKTERTMVQEKNRLFALQKQLELFSLDGFEKKLISRQKDLVKSFQRKFETETKLLKRVVHQCPQWKEFFEPIKGCGERTAGGMIGSIKRWDRFPNRYHLRSYAGMKKKKGDQNFKHPLKRALYFFAKGIIRIKNKFWYRLYLEMKKYYAKKHPDWKKGQVNNWAMKFIETKFLDQYYNYCKNGG